MIRSIFIFAFAVVVAVAFCGGGCASWRKPTPPPSAVARFFLEADAPQAGVELVLPVSEVVLRVVPKPVISEYDIAEVAEVQVDLGRCLAFRLTGPAARDLYRMSVSQGGKRLVLLINGQPLGARVLDGAIEGGVLFTFVELPDSALSELVRELNATAAFIQAQTAKAR
ncbi:hypothetical protein AXK11_04970 [Cephaloticoccus primus]|uniref:Preprotein translocase subunit SecD n=1 Tax=Cephaloticoccus primus TaxID=1548207 RepID=A0A139SMU2_9BACT|nr:hypothetical protein [Cephaloticoccus primus]KXU35888.1 hypothetical protein AXK11_04970 [Cephaloticoccus primus]